MILVDSPVWIDHLRSGDHTLRRLLDEQQVLIHPFVVAEIALGHLRQRAVGIDSLLALPIADAVTDDELLVFVAAHGLPGRGMGIAAGLS